MKKKHFIFEPIGIIHTRFPQQEGTPIQSAMAREETGMIEVFPEFAEGLLDIEGFSHLFLFYAFHQSGKGALKVKPYLDTIEHGIFATRAPKRPNPIGLSIVQLVARIGNSLEIAGIDMLDGTPLLDIKPYIPSFDHFQAENIGWYKDSIKKSGVVLADNRFDCQDGR